MTDQTTITDQGAIDVSFPTNSDLSALQYHYVKLDASEEAVACGANEKMLGILQNAPDGSSDEATAVIRIAGVSKLKLDEAVAHGNFLTCTAASKGEVADAAGEEYGAVSIGSGADGNLHMVLIARGETNASDA